MPLNIDYDHQNNIHTQTGARSAFLFLFPEERPTSLLDVGCGIGTWLKAAIEFGISDVYGVDGISIPPEHLLVPHQLFGQQDLTRPLNLGRKFDVVLCLEVAEHLDEAHSQNFIHSLTTHADTIYFSAACPGQLGQHHVNCQWPEYWQALFNAEGFACNDEPRWKLWDVDIVEPWYRQNLFKAVRSPENAGTEKRVHSVIHPEMLRWIFDKPLHNSYGENLLKQIRAQIENGSERADWYLKTPARALWQKLLRNGFCI